jgi:hypothetical protein
VGHARDSLTYPLPRRTTLLRLVIRLTGKSSDWLRSQLFISDVAPGTTEEGLQQRKGCNRKGCKPCQNGRMSVFILLDIYALTRLVSTSERAMFPTGAALGATGAVLAGALLSRMAAVAVEDSAFAAAAARPFTKRSPIRAFSRGVEVHDRRCVRVIRREAAANDERWSFFLGHHQDQVHPSFKPEEHERWLSPVSR